MNLDRTLAPLLLAAALPCQLASHVALITSCVPDAREIACRDNLKAIGLATSNGTVQWGDLGGWRGTFSFGATDPQDMCVGDLNRDGFADFLVAFGQQGVGVCEYPYGPSNRWWINRSARVIHVADVDGDGHDDVIGGDGGAANLRGHCWCFSGRTRGELWYRTGTASEGFGQWVTYAHGWVWVTAPYYGSSGQGRIYRLAPTTGAVTPTWSGPRAGQALGLWGIGGHSDALSVCSGQQIDVFDVAADGSLTPRHTLANSSGSYYEMFTARDRETGTEYAIGHETSGAFRCYDVRSGAELHAGGVYGPPNNQGNAVCDVDHDGKPNLLSIQSGGPVGSKVHQVVEQTLGETELRADQTDFTTAGGVQVLTGNVPGRAGQPFFAATSFTPPEPNGPVVLGEQLVFFSLLPFPGGQAGGMVDSQGGFTLQWNVPAGPFAGISLYHVVLTLDTAGTWRLDDTGIQVTRIH